MKKILSILCAATLLFAGCAKLEQRVDDLDQRVTELDQKVTDLAKKLNDEVNSLKTLIEALEENVFVTDVTETANGYEIALSNGETITIRHGQDGQDGQNGQNGQNGATPVISVIYEDGVYYWAVDGVALTDEYGNRIPVYSETEAPEFKYENGQWYYNTGAGWSPLAAAASGNCTFEEVRYDDASVTFVLDGGYEITLPRGAAFSLNIASTSVTINPGETKEVAYTVTGATETTVVYTIAEGGYSATVNATSISEGTISVTAPDPLTDGKVVVLAGDNTRAAMQVLTFAEGVLTVVETAYNVAAEGGAIEIPVTTNLEYTVSIPTEADWLTYVETKAVREETIVLNAAANTGAERTATVSLMVDGVSVQDIVITQAEGTTGGGEAKEAAFGDYYYSDGTWSAEYDATKTLIGIVCWIGDITATDPTLKAAYPDCTNGLVVSVNGSSTKWQTNMGNVGTWQDANLTGFTSINTPMSGTTIEYTLGYNHTQVIKAYNEANPDTKADIYEALVTLAEANPAPAGTSGWYIPSAKELSYYIYGDNDEAMSAWGTRAAQDDINSKLTAAGFETIGSDSTTYHSSSEFDTTNIYVWAQEYVSLIPKKKTYSYKLYPVLAF